MEENYYLIWFLLSVILMIIFKLRWNQHTNMNITLCFIIAPLAELGYYLLHKSTNLDEAMIANKLIYLGGCFLVTFVTLLILALLNTKHLKAISAILLSISLILYGFVLTINYNGIFYKHVDFKRTEDGIELVKQYGPTHLLLYVVLVGYSVYAMSLLIYALVRKNLYSTRTMVLFILILFFSIGSYFFNRVFSVKYELMPAAYDIFLILLLVVMERSDMYNISLTQASAILDKEENGFIALDKRRRFLGANESAVRDFPELSEQKVDALISLKKEPFREMDQWLNEFESWEQNNFETRITFRDKYYRIIFDYLKAGKRTKGIQIIIVDETKERKYTNLLKRYNKELSEEVKKQTEHIMDMQDKMILGLADMVENRDTNTGGHIKRTSDVIRILVGEMLKDPDSGVDDEFAKLMIKAAPMHDLGKIAVDDAILRKPGRFEPWEFDIMKTHAAKGATIVRQVLAGIEEPKFAKLAENVAHYHHERIDGSGYPDRLKGDEIPYEARIMAIADVYDALVSKRCYKDEMSYEDAYKIIEEGMGTQFDASLNKYFVACRSRLEDYYRESKRGESIEQK